MIFQAKNQPKMEEVKKLYGYEVVRKCVMKKEAGIEDDSCKKIWKDLGIEEVE